MLDNVIRVNLSVTQLDRPSCQQYTRQCRHSPETSPERCIQNTGFSDDCFRMKRPKRVSHFRAGASCLSISETSARSRILPWTPNSGVKLITGKTARVKYKGIADSRRYELLCRRLVLERLYNSACFSMATNARETKITEPAEDLTFHRFAAALRGHAVSFLGSKA
jgi:hypothetical protein